MKHVLALILVIGSIHSFAQPPSSAALTPFPTAVLAHYQRCAGSPYWEERLLADLSALLGEQRYNPETLVPVWFLAFQQDMPTDDVLLGWLQNARTPAAWAEALNAVEDSVARVRALVDPVLEQRLIQLVDRMMNYYVGRDSRCQEWAGAVLEAMAHQRGRAWRWITDMENTLALARSLGNAEALMNQFEERYQTLEHAYEPLKTYRR